MKNFGSVIVEGLIGVGKSTFSAILAEVLKGEYLPEPDEKTNPFLSDYYTDPKRWAYTMQVHLLSARYRAHQYSQSKALYHRDGWTVLDRSYFGDACFARVQDRLGLFDKREYESYFKLHKDMQTHILYPTVAIYLNATPEVCASRINKRMSEKLGRACEESIDLDYLRMLDDEIQVMKDGLKGNTLSIELDWNEDRSDEEIEQIIKSLVVGHSMDYGNMKTPQLGETWTGIGGVGV